MEVFNISLSLDSLDHRIKNTTGHLSTGDRWGVLPAAEWPAEVRSSSIVEAYHIGGATIRTIGRCGKHGRNRYVSGINVFFVWLNSGYLMIFGCLMGYFLVVYPPVM